MAGRIEAQASKFPDLFQDAAGAMGIDTDANTGAVGKAQGRVATLQLWTGIPI